MERPPENPHNKLSFQKSSQSLRSLKSAAEPANSNEIWLLTLSDLLMLLMIFFVFLLAAPIVQAGKSASSPTKAALSEKQTTTPITLRPRGTEVATPVVSPTPEAHDKQAVAALEDDLQNVLGSAEDRQGVTVERRSQFLIITFPEQILFDSGKAQMKTDAGPTLAKVATFIISHPELSVEVQGHTDDRPIRSQRYPSNWELSADRATQVARTLLERGANPRQVATKGFGEYRPVVPNASDADRLKNRRVEIQFSLHQS